MWRGVWMVLLVAACGGNGADVQGPHGIVGVQEEGYFYVVPVEGGVVLVDSGGDGDGKKLLAAVDGRTVKAILITHAHPDHSGGAHHLPGVKVLVHKDEVAMLEGVTRPSGFLPAIFTTINTWPPPEPQVVQGVEDGHEFIVGGDKFTAVHVPGHTDGSLVWHFRDVVFGGDSVMAFGPRIGNAGPILDEDALQATRSLERLRALDFTILLDGHVGRTDDAKSKL